MKIIFIQGDENTGKTTLCNRIDEWLQKEFIDEYSSRNGKKIEKMVVTKDISLDTDFFALYDIKQKESINHKRIIINSLSDEVKQFYKFKEFFEEHRNEKTDVVKDVINSCFDILLKNEKENKKDNKEIYNNIKEIYEAKERCLEEISEIHNSDSDIDTLKQKTKELVCNEIEKFLKEMSDIHTNDVKKLKQKIKELVCSKKKECLKKISDIPTNNVDTLKEEIKELLVYNKIEKCLNEIFNISTNDVDTLKQKIEDLDCDEIMKRISQSYTPSKMPDLLITAIRPSGTDSNKIIEVLDLDDLEKLNLSPKTIYSYQKDTSKDILLIKLEKTPLELIKEKIRELF